MNPPYGKGCIMTFQVEPEKSEIPEKKESWDCQHLLPREAALLQENIVKACDSMEYAGSPMYDEYPDRVTVEWITDQICGERKNDPSFHSLVQVLLCHEMGCRREGCKKNRPRPPHSPHWRGRRFH